MIVENNDVMQEEKPDVIDEIKKDHRLVEEYYANYKSTKDKEERKYWFNQFVWAVTAHSAAEEAIVYSLIESINEKGKELGMQSRLEHDEFKKKLEELSKEHDEAQFNIKFEEAVETLMEHVTKEETEDLVFLFQHVDLRPRQIACEMFLKKKLLIPNQSNDSGRHKTLESAIGVLDTPIDKVRSMLIQESQGFL